MRIPRIYHNEIIPDSGKIFLNEESSHYIINVLRMQLEQKIIIFHQENIVFLAKIVQINKKRTQVEILSQETNNKESLLNIHLGQVISRGDKMDFTIQKAVELGVSEITPLFSERCGVKLEQNRLDKKINQWNKIAISACEQSGRNVIPNINPTIHLNEWISKNKNSTKIVLSPYSTNKVSQLKTNDAFTILIGPEGGLTNEEIQNSLNQNFIDISLGNRILRTETSALVIISALQTLFGDFN